MQFGFGLDQFLSEGELASICFNWLLCFCHGIATTTHTSRSHIEISRALFLCEFASHSLWHSASTKSTLNKTTHITIIFQKKWTGSHRATVPRPCASSSTSKSAHQRTFNCETGSATCCTRQTSVGLDNHTHCLEPHLPAVSVWRTVNGHLSLATRDRISFPQTFDTTMTRMRT